jgi:preprotein translocase subunit SecY
VKQGGARSRNTPVTEQLCLALFQGLGIAIALESQAGLVLDPGPMFRFVTVLTLLTGTMFLMWLGEQITERGMGNGISIIIFAGIVAGLPSCAGRLVRTGPDRRDARPFRAVHLHHWWCWSPASSCSSKRGQRKILVNYAKRQVGNKVYGGQSSHLPLKLNMSGVIPPIFASSIILFPATQGQWFGSGEGMTWLKDIAAHCLPGQPIYVMSVCRRDRFLLLLLHRPGVQLQGNGGQPEERAGPSSPGSVPATRPRATSTRFSCA